MKVKIPELAGLEKLRFIRILKDENKLRLNQAIELVESRAEIEIFEGSELKEWFEKVL
jgi:hypothetical protein